jgi:hypothetical protein
MLRYQVVHAVYGEIGSYSNLIDRTGDEISVRNEVHLKVSVLGITLHREDGERTERWKGDRLVEFHGRTVTNGDSTEVSGQAQGDQFAVTTAQTTILAPADVRPSNPWSGRILKSNHLLRSDSGRVEQISVSAPVAELVTINNLPVSTRRFAISSNPAYQIWLDEDDVPVMFSVDDESGLVTFTLVQRD